MAAIVDTRQASLLCIQEVQLLQRDRATLRIICTVSEILCVKNNVTFKPGVEVV